VSILITGDGDCADAPSESLAPGLYGLLRRDFWRNYTGSAFSRLWHCLFSGFGQECRHHSSEASSAKERGGWTGNGLRSRIDHDSARGQSCRPEAEPTQDGRFRSRAGRGSVGFDPIDQSGVRL
jgi:hypothetical protein